MSEKTLSSKPLLYLGIGRNKYYNSSPNHTNQPNVFFPYGIFFRFSQDIEKTQGVIYDFFDNPTQNLLLPNQRDVLLQSQYFENDCYIDCFFKTPTLIFAFLEEYNQVFIFKESGSNLVFDKDMLTARMQSLSKKN